MDVWQVFFTYLGRELRQRKRQTIVMAAGLAVGIGLVITVNGASAGVADAQSQVLQSLYGVGTDITVTQQVAAGSGQDPGQGRFDFGSGDTTSSSVTQDRLTLAGRGLTTIDSSVIDTIATQPHVARAVGSLALEDVTVTGTFTPPSSEGTNGATGGFQNGGTRPQFDLNTVSVNGVDVNSTDVGPLSSATLVNGRAFTTDDANAAVALISSDYANDKALAVGDTITLAGTQVSVIGIVSSTSEGTNVFLPLGEAQTLAGQAGKVSTVYVQASSAADVSTAQSEIETAVPGTTVTTAADLASQISGSLSSAAGLANHLGRWLSVIVLIAAFGLAALLTISGVSRRTREFGTLKALGWRGKRVIGQVVGESLVQGLAGGVLGIGLGVAGAFLVGHFAPALTAEVASGLGGNNTGPAGGPGGAAPGGGQEGFSGQAFRAASQVAVRLSVPVTVASIGLAVGLAVAGGLLAGAFGGWRAAKLRPADALRRFD